MITIPQDVQNALDKLDDSTDKDTILSYINKLQDELSELKGDGDAMKTDNMDNDEMNDQNNNDEMDDNDEPAFPPTYSSGEDYDKATEAKQLAADCKANNDYEQALEHYNTAVLAAPPSALLLANRASCLLQLGRPRAALRDCDHALRENPDSALGYRVRGIVRKLMGQYELALTDLSAAQAIDYDESIVADLKFLTEKHLEMEKQDAAKRNEQEEQMRKKAQDAKRARQEEYERKMKDQTPSSSASGNNNNNTTRDMPGGGMPAGGGGGMPGNMGDMAGMAQMLMSDPELAAALQNPKVQQAFQKIMSSPGGPMSLLSNPGELANLMSDPEVGPVIGKIMGKLGGGGGGAGMGGGFPGMGGFGGAGGAAADGNGDDMDDIPDLDAN